MGQPSAYADQPSKGQRSPEFGHKNRPGPWFKLQHGPLWRLTVPDDNNANAPSREALNLKARPIAHTKRTLTPVPAIITLASTIL
jgi:hypothetical protein